MQLAYERLRSLPPGVDFKVKVMEFKGKKLNLRIWDTGIAGVLCLFIGGG